MSSPIISLDFGHPGRAIGGAALLLLLALSTGCVSRLLYYPDGKVYQTPKDRGLRFEEVRFASSDGTILTGWFVPATKPAIGTVIHFHGNAQNMTAHFSFVDWLPAKGFNVFTFDYRGYGASAGRPERRGVLNDCISAIEYVGSRPDVDPDALLVLGQSLGGANALTALGERRFAGVKAVAIDSTFYSYRSIVRDKIGQIPVLSLARWPLSFLVIDNRHSPGAVVQNISPAPLLLLHGTADRVIPYHHAQDLIAKARGTKQLWTIPGADHTEALTRYGALYRQRLVEFFEAAIQKPAKPNE